MPKGGQLFAVPYVIHRDPRWFPNPDKFDPARFAHEGAAYLHAGAFLAFGTGPRVCPGAALGTIGKTKGSGVVFRGSRREGRQKRLSTPLISPAVGACPAAPPWRGSWRSIERSATELTHRP